MTLKLQSLSLRDKGLPASLWLGLCSISEMQSSGCKALEHPFSVHVVLLLDHLFRIRVRID